MSQAFATVEDVEARWRVLSPSEKERAEVLLSDASAIIRARFTLARKDISKADPEMLKIVCCDIVIRAMDKPSSMDGVTSMTQTAGVYSQTYSYAQYTSGIKLLRDELVKLGLYGAGIGSIKPHIGYGGDDE